MADPRDDDDKWLDALAGRSTDVTPEAAREVEALRRVLRSSESAGAATGDPAEEERRLQGLLFRLRRERLLERSRLVRFGVPLALAAGVALLFVAVQPGMFFAERAVYDEPPAFRGAVAQQAIVAAKPREQAENLARDLAAQGIAARLYQKGDSFTVDFNLPADAPRAAQEALARAGAKASTGDNRVVFTRP